MLDRKGVWWNAQAMEMRQQQTPLSRRQLFQTFDLDQARAIVASKFCAHRLDRNRRDDRFDAVHNHVGGHAVSLNYLRYGADVLIEPGELTSFYLLQIPITGAAEIACGREFVEVSTARASLLNPQRHTRMRWGSGCEKILVQIDRSAMEAVAEDLIDRPLPTDLIFDCGVDLTTGPMRQWLSRLFALVAAANVSEIFAADGSLRQAAVERELIEGLLRLQRSTISHRIEDRARGAPRSGVVRSALSFIRSKARSPLTIAEIAEEVGVSERTLQNCFRAELGISPKQALTEERLNGVHEELSDGNAIRSVGEIARDWGFNHQGRFSAAYRARFGVYPKMIRATRKSGADRGVLIN